MTIMMYIVQDVFSPEQGSHYKHLSNDDYAPNHEE